MSDHNKSDHQNKNWTFFPIVPFCLGGLRREPDVSGRRVRPVVLISPGYGRGGRRPAPDMPITMMHVVTKIMREGYWTEDAVCLTAGGINRGRANTSHSGTCNILWRVNPETGRGQRHWRPVRGDLPGHVARSAGNLVQNYCGGRSRSGSWPTPSSDCRRFSESFFYSNLGCLRC